MKIENFKLCIFSKSFIALVVLFCLTSQKSPCQDATFSQFYNNPIYYNPAYTGSNQGLRAKLNYRNQWNNLPANYDNYTFIMDVAEPNLPGAGGLGMIVQSNFDGFGNVKTTSATLSASAKVHPAENFLTQFGMGLSFVHRSINWDDFVFSDMLDPRYGKVNNTYFNDGAYDEVNYPDFSAGILFRYCESAENMESIVGTISLGVQHVFNPDISFEGEEAKLPLKLVIMGDMLFDNNRESRNRNPKKNKMFKLNPAFLFEKQGTMSNFSIGINGYKNYIYSGLWLRTQSFTFSTVNDFIMMIGINMPFGESTRIKLRYSYDYVLSGLRRTVGATHEISLVYELDNFGFFGSSTSKPSGRGKQKYGPPSCNETFPF